ncbi:MAG TPA: hypothetical protein VGF99_11485 [Myxococcota bacterium]
MLLALLLTVAAASDLDAAQKAWVDVEYGRCRDKAQAALLVPATTTERVTGYRLLGLCAAAGNDTDAAREAFRMMLAIDPTARLPDGLSPRFTSSFREAKGSWVGVTPLALSVVDDTPSNGGRRVVVGVADDAELVDRITWRAAGGTTGKPVRTATKVELDLPAGPEIVVVALDKSGGEVATLTLPAAPTSTTPSPLDPQQAPPPAVADDDGAIWPFVIGGAAGGLIVVGGAAALVVVLLSPPSEVVLKTDVGFADR